MQDEYLVNTELIQKSHRNLYEQIRTKNALSQNCNLFVQL